MTALTQADRASGILLRLVQLGEETETVEASGELFRRASAVKSLLLNEKPLGEIAASEGRAFLSLDRKKIVTLGIE